jgi:GH24 family phage-related lysozyme (muramidase)
LCRTLDFTTECPPGGKITTLQGVISHDYGNGKTCSIFTLSASGEKVPGSTDKSCTHRIDNSEVCITSDDWTIASNADYNMFSVKRPDGVVINFVRNAPPGLFYTWVDPDSGITFDGKVHNTKTINNDGTFTNTIIGYGTQTKLIYWNTALGPVQKQEITTYSCAIDYTDTLGRVYPCAYRLASHQSDKTRTCDLESFTIVCKSTITPKPGSPSIPTPPTIPSSNPCPVSFDTSQIKSNGKIAFVALTPPIAGMTQCVTPPPPKKECNPAGSDATPIVEIHMSSSAVAILEGFEGDAGKLADNRRLTGDTYGLYDDGKTAGTGNCTEGIGRLIHHGPCTLAEIASYHIRFPNGQSKEQAERQLAMDVAQKEREVTATLGPDVKLTQNQFDALISLAFNTGANGALNRLLSNGRTLGEDIRSGNCGHAAIADDFGLLPGDTSRHQSEAAIFNFGVYNVPQHLQ